MLQVPHNISAVDIAFGNISHMPKYADIPDEFKRDSNPYVRAISSWFFNGAKGTKNGIILNDVTYRARPGVDATQALGAIKSVLGSFEPILANAPPSEWRSKAELYDALAEFRRAQASIIREAGR